jgi:hypothetical protein
MTTLRQILENMQSEEVAQDPLPQPQLIWLPFEPYNTNARAWHSRFIKPRYDIPFLDWISGAHLTNPCGLNDVEDHMWTFDYFEDMRYFQRRWS